MCGSQNNIEELIIADRNMYIWSVSIPLKGNSHAYKSNFYFICFDIPRYWLRALATVDNNRPMRIRAVILQPIKTGIKTNLKFQDGGRCASVFLVISVEPLFWQCFIMFKAYKNAYMISDLIEG